MKEELINSTYVAQVKRIDLKEAVLDRVRTFSIIPKHFPASRVLFIERHQKFKIVLAAERKKVLIIECYSYLCYCILFNLSMVLRAGF